MCLSNMKFLYVFYLILMITSEIQTDNEMKMTPIQKDPICEGLKNNNDTEFNIVAIGKTSKQILLMTNKYYVYDVSINSLDVAHDELYLPTKPITLIEKYPILYENQMFTQMRKMAKISNALIINDGKSDHLHSDSICIPCITDPNIFVILVCNVYNSHRNDPRTKQQKKQKNKKEINQHSFSDPSSSRIFDHKKINSVEFDIALYYSILATEMFNIPFEQIALDSTISELTTIEFLHYLSSKKCLNKMPFVWRLKGFVSDNKFYLFGHSYIYIFDEAVYNNQGKEYPVQKISYHSYFICQDKKIPTRRNRKKGKLISMMQYVFLVFFLILS
ncbi:uncharacterized protein LOC113794786, partial [Dermatophagoides pteronyssinus]|uniref:uncharacterized protein LOC113794786 n=1 Tax=Dermatophagoides pteronyssinus TaxID=6956 RepID=UPI003F66D27B